MTERSRKHVLRFAGPVQITATSNHVLTSTKASLAFQWTNCIVHYRFWRSSAMSHYVTFYRPTHVDILQLKSERHCWKHTDRIKYSIPMIADQTETTDVSNRFRRGRPFSRELSVAQRDRSPIAWLWRPVWIYNASFFDFWRWQPSAILDLLYGCVDHPRRVFGGLCHCAKNPKNPIFGAWIGFFKPKSRNRKTCILSKLLHRFQPNFAQW